MKEKLIPGTVLPFVNISGGMFEYFIPVIKATDGISLGQLVSITGLESSTIQNWIKRGYVAHPVKKKYYERHLARILLISALRESVKIERIGEIMASVNGDTDDEGDDIIAETELYDYFCAVIEKIEIAAVTKETVCNAVDAVLRGYKGSASDTEKIKEALFVMVTAYISALFRKESEKHFEKLLSI